MCHVILACFYKAWGLVWLLLVPIITLQVAMTLLLKELSNNCLSSYFLRNFEIKYKYVILSIFFCFVENKYNTLWHCECIHDLRQNIILSDSCS